LNIWYDACTGKHVRYGVAVAQHLRREGHEVIITTRKHPDTIPLLKLLGEKYKVIGEYSPSSPNSRLKASLKRQLTICEMFEKNSPDLAISHGSIDLCRVAFGLGIPIISTADAPHATAANKLGIPLVDVLIISEAIPLHLYEAYGATEIIQFKGVDEVAWIKNARNDPEKKDEPLIVVRQMETLASYASKEQDFTERIAQRLVNLGKVIFLPRYEKKPRTNLNVPLQFVDTVSLSAKADLVISVGGTLSRESALQGIPSIVINTFGKSYVNDYLTRIGFPLFTVETDKVLRLAKKLIGQKFTVKKLLRQLENPIDYMEKVITR
jgi:predicted glycosyltransferase